MKFLIIDDNPDDRELMIHELKKEFPDAVYDEVSRRDHFDEAIGRSGFDLVFTDFRLNWADGLWVLDQFKARHPRVPVIMVTDTGNEEIAVKGMKAGLSDYVLKKYLFQLLLAVKETLERERLRGKYEAAQKALQEAHAQLETRVKERTADLLQANNQLKHEIAERIRVEEELKRKTAEAEEASRTKTYFLSAVSHELRTPLNGILGYAQLLMDGIYGPLSADQKEPLEGIRRNAKDQLRLINDLLDLTRIESKKMSVDVEPVDLQRLLQDVYKGMRPLFDTKSLSVRWEIEPIPAIESDPHKIRQIVTNLFSNALKFTRKGGMTVLLQAQEEKVKMVVRDTGVGIPPNEFSKIFEAFHQIDSSSTREFGGVGLGLAIVKELVSLLEGEIRVESVVGEGTTFTLLLPRQLSKSEPVRQDQSANIKERH